MTTPVRGTVRRPRAVEGGLLILVMVVLVAVSTLAVGLMGLSTADAVETARRHQSVQAFWHAESGLQQALAMIHGNETYRDNPGNTNWSGGTVYYSWNVSVAVRQHADWDEYSVTSAARSVLSSWQRTLAQKIAVSNSIPAAFDYALFGGGQGTGTMDLAKDTFIDGGGKGGVFQYGDIDFGKDSTVTNGEVYATGDVTGDVQGSTPLPDPPPAMPVIDTSDFLSKIAYAATHGAGTVPDPLHLNGSNLYYAGDQDVGEVNGPGTATVAQAVSPPKKDDFVLNDNTALVVGGDLSVDKDQSFANGSNILMYVEGDVDIRKLGSGQKCMLICNGDITIKKELDFEGMIYATGSISIDKLDAEGKIVGSIIAGGSIRAKKNLTVEYDPGLFAGGVPPWIETELSVTPSAWQEL